MKIVKLIYQSYLPYQGRYPRVSGQAKILLDGGHDVTVLACDREAKHPSSDVLDGIKVKRLPVKTGEMRGPFFQFFPLLLFWWKALGWLSRHSFDVLHCHNLDVLPLGWLMKASKSCRVVFDAHEPDYYALWPKKWRPFLGLIDRLEIFLARRVDFVTVTNDYQVNKYRKNGVKHVDLVGNYPLPGLRTEKLLEDKFSGKVVTFGRLGTVYSSTGFEETLAAFTKVIKDYPQARLLIGGRVTEEYEQSFRSLLRPLEEYVEFLGSYFAEQMPEIYKRIDVSLLVYPKNQWFRHITPRKFFDSVANGVPVIMTDIGGLGDVIKRSECGWLVDEKDIDSIAEAMIEIITNSEDRRRVASNALHLAQTEYDWKAMAERFLGIQQAVLAR